MDIRVAAYSPTASASSASRSTPTSNAFATAATQSTGNPVSATAATQNSTQSQIAANPNDGYTDSVRGSIINILA